MKKQFLLAALVSLLVLFAVCPMIAEDGAKAAAELVVNENERHINYECSGKSVEVNGNENVITLSGRCDNLSVKGNDNIIKVGIVASISTAGNNNNVTWIRATRGKKPAITDSGTDNVIVQEKQ